jgi:hypothetical protein
MLCIRLPRISDLAQIRKWEWFERCSAVHGDPGTSIDKILSRIPGQTLPPPDDPLSLLSCPKPTLWPNKYLSLHTA